MKRVLSVGCAMALLALAFVAGSAPRPARADIACWSASSTIPAYGTPNLALAPLCDAFGNLKVTGSFPTPIPQPTDTAGIPYVHPTGGPFPVSPATTFPVSVATTLPVSVSSMPPVSPATTFPVSIATTLPISGTVTASMPYSAATSQPTTAASFVGIGGSDGTVFRPLNVSTGGVVKTQSCSASGNTCSTAGTPTDGLGASMGVFTVNQNQVWSGTVWNNMRDVTAYGGSNTGLQAVGICDRSGSACGQVVTNSTGYGALVGPATQSVMYAWNGSALDQLRKDTYTAAPLWTSGGGATTATVAAGTGTTVIKASAGRVAGYTITSAGTSGNATCYDNASTGSGTVLLVVPGATGNTAAQIGFSNPGTWSPPAANGITCVGASGSPAFTISYW